MEGLVLIILVVALSIFDVAALCWGADSREEAIDPRVAPSRIGLTV